MIKKRTWAEMREATHQHIAKYQYAQNQATSQQLKDAIKFFRNNGEDDVANRLAVVLTKKQTISKPATEKDLAILRKKSTKGGGPIVNSIGEFDVDFGFDE